MTRPTFWQCVTAHLNTEKIMYPLVQLLSLGVLLVIYVVHPRIIEGSPAALFMTMWLLSVAYPDRNNLKLRLLTCHLGTRKFHALIAESWVHLVVPVFATVVGALALICTYYLPATGFQDPALGVLVWLAPLSAGFHVLGRAHWRQPDFWLLFCTPLVIAGALWASTHLGWLALRWYPGAADQVGVFFVHWAVITVTVICSGGWLLWRHAQRFTL